MTRGDRRRWPAEEQVLDPEARARVTARVLDRGPALVRRTFLIRTAVRTGAAAGSAALLAMAIAIAARRDSPVPPPDPRPCASFEVPVASAVGPRFDLGPRALAVASEGAHVRLAVAERCLTSFGLERGRLTVHARDLGQGELRVESLGAEVLVRGTVFAVERDGEELVVEVAEGRIELRWGTISVVDAGERLRAAAGSVLREPLPRSSQDELLRAVGLLPPPVETLEPAPPAKESTVAKKRPKRRRQKQDVVREPSTDELVKRANAARKRGDFDGARELFQRAGRTSGPTAEAAWIGLGRMELDQGRAGAAVAALAEHDRRFPSGVLAVEAAWLRVRALDATGARYRAKLEARAILEKWPDSAQAASARRWLRGRP